MNHWGIPHLRVKNSPHYYFISDGPFESPRDGGELNLFGKSTTVNTNYREALYTQGGDARQTTKGGIELG